MRSVFPADGATEIAEVTRRQFLEAVGGGSAYAYVADTEADEATPPSVQPIFSYPDSGSPDTRHEDLVMRLLKQAVPDTSVYASIFTLTREDVSQAFIDAERRGVDVNVLVDEQSSHRSAVQTLRDELPDRTAIVEDGGIGDRHNHNKFLLLDRLATGDEHVVWQSSSNLTTAQTRNHNASVVIRNDDALHEAFQQYWADLADETVEDLSYNRTDEGRSATAYFSPRDDFDTHVRALADVVPSWETKIHFMQSIWTDSREAESQLIQERLAELIEGGADVQVIVQDGDEVTEHLQDAGADVMAYPGENVAVHSKYMLIDSDFETESGDTEHRREVWVGSQNLSRPGLRRNDEALLRFVDDYVYAEFLDDWERVYRQGERALRDNRPTPIEYNQTTSDSESDISGSESPTQTDGSIEAREKNSVWNGLSRLGIATALAGGIGSLGYAVGQWNRTQDDG